MRMSIDYFRSSTRYCHICVSTFEMSRASCIGNFLFYAVQLKPKVNVFQILLTLDG